MGRKAVSKHALRFVNQRKLEHMRFRLVRDPLPEIQVVGSYTSQLMKHINGDDKVAGRS